MSIPVHNAPLSPTQLTVLNSLCEGNSISAAAEAAGVHRSTIHMWRRQTTFAAAYDEACRARAEFIRDGVSALAGKALDTVRQILDNEAQPATVRLKAALSVLHSSTLTQPEYRPIPTNRMTGAQLDQFFDAVFLAAEREVSNSHDRLEAGENTGFDTIRQNSTVCTNPDSASLRR
ncbi:MAG: hypothetical protein HY235_09445 [Acidobacteria bacterium]|nr:hypothetical protein [Acidobacteriota bacterium]